HTKPPPPPPHPPPPPPPPPPPNLMSFEGERTTFSDKSFPLPL
ncbi:hypothetical protein J2Z29_002841, partial [Treponema pedis]